MALRQLELWIPLIGILLILNACIAPVPAGFASLATPPGQGSMPRATPSRELVIVSREQAGGPGVTMTNQTANLSAEEVAIEHIPGVEVLLFAGTGQRGGIDGPGDEATFDGPFSLGLDDSGNLYVSELGGGRIRVIDSSGFVWTWVGTAGPADGWPGSAAGLLLRPQGIAVTSQGQVYVVDGRHRLVLIDDGQVVHVAGTVAGFRDGPAGEAALNSPADVTIGPGGVVCISDARNNRVRMLSTAGQLGTLAGSGAVGFRDGVGLDAEFSYPTGLAFDHQGLLYIADGGWLSSLGATAPVQIRVLDSTGRVSTYAGLGHPGYVDGLSHDAQFRGPVLGMTFDGRDNLYVPDAGNHAVRVVTREGTVMTIAGTGEYGLQEGPGAEAMLGLPTDVLWDGKNALYVADYGQNVIWLIRLPDDIAAPGS